MMSTPNETSTSTNSVWVADPYHTQVEFAAKHLGMMTVRGHFAEVKVAGTIDPGQHDATDIEVTIQTASIHTNNEQRDNDLRASNFLEVDKYPTMTFKSTNVKHVGGDRYTLTGDLTIKGTTHPVTLNLVRYGEFNDPMMGHRISYGGETQISRKDFGMTFNAMLDGKWIVSDEVQILIEGELVEQKQA
jgi:polyisoprenoid-binding protein YceI